MVPEIIESSINAPTKAFQDQLTDFYELTKKAKSSNTRRAYEYGWDKFINWMDEQGYKLPNNHDGIALHVGMFIAAMVKTRELSYNSLVSYHAAIKHHIKETMNIELDHPKLKEAMRAAANDLKKSPIKKEALKTEHLAKISSNISQSTRLTDLRDTALLMIGFCCAMRRSELVGIDLEHISFDPEGISIRIPSSKTDQIGKGHHVEIPRRFNEAIDALNKWLSASGITSGPIFRPITKHGVILNQRLSAKSVAEIVKKRANGILNKNDVAGHSLRRGFVMSSLEADVNLVTIMNQTRHASVNTLKEYASDKKNYKTNALNSITL